MEKKTNEKKTRVYNLVVSKMIYLEAIKFAKRHKVWWSRISVTEVGDPVEGNVSIEFRCRISRTDLMARDSKYLSELEAVTIERYFEGKKQLFLHEKVES